LFGISVLIITPAKAIGKSKREFKEIWLYNSTSKSYAL
jgi:hypothetical protein